MQRLSALAMWLGLLTAFIGCDPGKTLLLTKIVDNSTPAPNASTFSAVRSASTDGESVGFMALRADNTAGIYRWSVANGMEEMWADNDFTSFYLAYGPFLDNGTAAFTTITQPVPMSAPVVETHLNSGGVTTVTSLDNQSLAQAFHGGKIATVWATPDSSQKEVRVFDGSSSSMFVDLIAEGFLAINDFVLQTRPMSTDRLLFIAARIEGSALVQGIYLANGSNVSKLLDSTEYGAYQSITIDGDDLYFSTLQSGIYSYNLSTQADEQIVAPGEAAPGGGKFKYFSTIGGNSEDGILFRAVTEEPENFGVFASINGTIYKVVCGGDTVDGKAVLGIDLGPQPAAGQIGVVMLSTVTPNSFESLYLVDLTKDNDGNPLEPARAAMSRILDSVR